MGQIQYRICVRQDGGPDAHPDTWSTTRDTYTREAAVKRVEAKYRTWIANHQGEWVGIRLVELGGPFGLLARYPPKTDYVDELPCEPDSW